MQLTTVKKSAKKVWHFLWEDESIWSLLVNAIIAFVLIKYLIYPGLGFILATNLPIVAVVSGSMEHDGSFDEWWMSSARCNAKVCTQEEWYQRHEITKAEFKEYAFRNGFNKGDIMILKGTEAKNINTGDVIVFQADRPDPIIHRVVKITNTGGSRVFYTKGDHNIDMGDIDQEIQENEVLGKAIFRIPLLGWIKILFMYIISPITGGVSNVLS